jgi:hypothetical protein
LAACQYPTGYIFTSTNSGSTWTQTSAPQKNWSAITSSSDGTIIAASVFTAGFVYTSINSGSNWTQISPPSGAPTGDYNTITSSSDGLKLAVFNNSGLTYTSTNSGSTWTQVSSTGNSVQSSTSSSDGTKLAVCSYNTNNSGGYIYTSTNSGSSWTQTSALFTIWMGIASSSDGTKLAACRYRSGPGTGGIYISANSGSTWTKTSAPDLLWFKIASSSDGSRLAAVAKWNGVTGGLHISIDSGSTWTQSIGPGNDWTGITSSSDGTKLAACASSNNYIYTYTGPYNIASTATNAISNYQVQPKSFIQHPTLAFGSGQNIIAYSPDGINWTGLGTTIFTTAGRKALWNGKLWVASGSGTNSLAYSYDGTTWTGVGSTVFASSTGLAYNGSIWVAVGAAGGATIAYSTNGINWKGVAGSTAIFTGTGGFGVTWNGTTFVASGQGTNALATSTNGITWTAVSSATTYASAGVYYSATNGPLLVAAVNSSVGLIYTTDRTGQTGWTAVSPSPFSTNGSSVTWNGSIWVATGAGTNKVAYSTNGINWTGLSIPSASLSDVCWNGTRFVATGTSYMAYSTDGITWISNNLPSIFSSNGYGVASNSGVGAFVAPSALVLSDTGISGNAMTASSTLEVVSSDPYFQTGFNNITVKIETQNIY